MKRIIMFGFIGVLLASVLFIYWQTWFDVLSTKSPETYSEIIIAAVDNNYPPHEFVEDGQIRGFNVDLLRAVAREMKVQIQFVPMAWQEAMAALQAGDVDLLLMAESDSRRKTFDFSEPVLDLTLAMFVRSDETGLTQIQDLKGRIVAVQADDIAHQILEERVPQATIIKKEKHEEAIQALATGEVDVYFGNYQTGSYLVKELGIRHVRTIGASIPIEPRAIAVTKGNVTLVRRLNEGITKVRKSKEYDKLVSLWYGADITTLLLREVGAVGLSVLLILAAATSGLFLWNRALQRTVSARSRDLGDSEVRYRALVDQMPLGMAMCDSLTEVTYANTATSRLFGFDDPQDLVGRKLYDFSPENGFTLRKWLQELGNSNQKASMYQGEFSRTDGKVLELEVMAVKSGLDESHLLIMNDITQRTETLNALMRSSERLSALHELDRAILAAQSPQEIALAALTHIHSLIRFEQASVFLFRQNLGNFEALASLQNGNGTRKVDYAWIWEGSERRIEELRYGKVQVVGDIYALEETSSTMARLLKEGIRSFVNVPLNTGENFIGFMNLGWKYPNAVKAEQIEIASQVATTLAVAIRQSRLLTAEHKHRQESETLREMTTTLVETLELKQVLDRILDKLQLVVPYTSTSIFLTEGEQMVLGAQRGFKTAEQFAITLHISGASHLVRVMEGRRPIIISDVRMDDSWQLMEGSDYIRCWMGVPLVVKDQVIGLLNLDHDEPSVYSEEHAKLVLAFANQASIAIDNARQYEQLQRRLEQMASLRKLERAITSSLDLRETLNVLLDQVQQLLKTDGSSVMLVNRRTMMLDLQARRGFRLGTGQTARIRIGEGLAGVTAAEGQLLHISDLQNCNIPFDRVVCAEEGFLEYWGIPLKVKQQVVGVLELWVRNPQVKDQEWMEQLEILSDQAAIAIENATLFDEMQRFNLDLEAAYDLTLEGWAKALEMRDQETEDHTRRVTEMTIRLARALGFDDRSLVDVRRGAILHDIGKMGIDDSILKKPGPLTEDEWEVMRLHPVHAYEWLSRIPFLKPALDIPYYHHERWDGSGYPHGLRGEEIPLAARIFAVVDVWDALRSNRRYRPAWSDDEVRAYLKDHAGELFDPYVVEVFLRIWKERSQLVKNKSRETNGGVNKSMAHHNQE